MIELGKTKVGKTPLRTRGGLTVERWWLQEDVEDSFFPIRAIIRIPDGTTAEMPFNRNGRRFINTESEWDLFVCEPKRKRRSTEKLGTMPDVMRAIACARAKDTDGIASANKYRFPSAGKEDKIRYNYAIVSHEGLG